MEKVYRTTIEVRGYELDSYGHVNHAVYIQYLEHARWKMLQDEGITLNHFTQWKCWPVIAGLEVKYLKPTFVGDQLEVETRLIEFRRTGFRLEQKIFRSGTQVLHGVINAVMVNERGRPTAMPQEMERVFLPAIERALPPSDSAEGSSS